jgi:hypothetical protein
MIGRRAYTKLSKVQKGAIEADYMTGMKNEDICIKHGINNARLYSIIKTPTKVAKPTTGRNLLTRELKQQVLAELTAQQQTIPDICKQYKINRGTVYRWRTEININAVVAKTNVPNPEITPIDHSKSSDEQLLWAITATDIPDQVHEILHKCSTFKDKEYLLNIALDNYVIRRTNSAMRIIQILLDNNFKPKTTPDKKLALAKKLILDIKGVKIQIDVSQQKELDIITDYFTSKLNDLI